MRLLLACAFLAAVTVTACTPAMKGSRALRAADYPAAITFYQEALADNPGDVWTRRQLGRAYVLDGKYDLAAAELGGLLAVRPSDWEATYYLALAHIGQGRRRQGFAEIREMVIPFAYRMKQDLVRASTAYEGRSELDAAIIVSALDQALVEAKERQAQREAGDKTRR